MFSKRCATITLSLVLLFASDAMAGPFTGSFKRYGHETVTVTGSASFVRYGATGQLSLSFLGDERHVSLTLDLPWPRSEGVSPQVFYEERNITDHTHRYASQAEGQVQVTPESCHCQGGRLALRILGADGVQVRINGRFHHGDSAGCLDEQGPQASAWLSLSETDCPGEPSEAVKWATGHSSPPSHSPAPAPSPAPDVYVDGGCGGSEPEHWDDDGGCDGGDWDDGGDSGCESSDDWGDSSGGGCESDGYSDSGGSDGCESDGYGDSGGSDGCESDGYDGGDCEGDDWGSAHASVKRQRRSRSTKRRGLPPFGLTLPYILVGLLAARTLRPSRRRRRR